MENDRKIGVEIEFAGISAEQAACILCRRFQGRSVEQDVFRWNIEGTQFGDFNVELDTKYVHKDGISVAIPKDIRKVIGDVSEGFVPVEIVCPPIKRRDIVQLDQLVEDLKKAGAQGSDAHPLNAFGLHLNVEEPSDRIEDIWAIVKVFALLDPWLRAQIDVDAARGLLPHIDAYPRGYILRFAGQQESPDWPGFIDGYLKFNPTRNRALDMLPLLAHHDEPRLKAVIDDPRVKPRPAFHYRLPQCNFNDPNFSIVREVSRWEVVEKLSHDKAALTELSDLYEQEMAKILGHWEERLNMFMDDWFEA